jgi:predicted  nucleic acid-binding Zn-ribbon protein
MALLDPLIELQDLDLRTDRLGLARETLPEREALKACGEEIVDTDRLQSATREKRDGLARREREVAGEVSLVAAGAVDVEGRLYSGTVTVPKELEALQDELRLTRAKQAGLEERELEIMEEIEAEDSELARLAGLSADAKARGEALRASIGDAEEKIEAELASLADRRGAPLAALPAEFAESYAALREKPRLGGRAAASLRDGVCQGCRVRLPRMDLSRILAEPEEARVQCPHCTRLLVR